MNAPTVINPKVRKVLPLCGSPLDAEVLAACRRIGAILAKDGLSYVDLAGVLPVEGTAPSHPTWNEEAWRTAARPPARPRPCRAYTPRQEQEHRARVRFCQNYPGRLTEWERGFVASVARLHGNLSIRQGDRLAVIVDLIERKGRCPC